MAAVAAAAVAVTEQSVGLVQLKTDQRVVLVVAIVVAKRAVQVE